jgi:putative transposase
VSYVEQFVTWYNFEHQHPSIDYLCPYEVHFGEHTSILKQRNNQLSLNRIKHPSRHCKIQKTYKIPEYVELKHRVPCQKTG